MSDTAVDEPFAPGATDQKDVVDVALSPGAQLALRRQERGWSIEEVAAQLNLAPRQIHAIETENYAALPGMASVRGFIRGYAKILKIDATPLLAMITKEAVVLREPAPLRRAHATQFSETPLPRMGRTGLSSKILLAVCVVALLLAGVFAVQQPDWLPALHKTVVSRLGDLGISSESAPDVQRSDRMNAVAIEANSAAPVDNVATISEPIRAAPEAPAPSADTSLPNPAIASANALVLTLRQDSWIEVIGANKTALISRLVRAGTTETIEITDQATLTVGNASGVDATWRGIPLDLKSAAKKNSVVRLNLK